MSALGHKQTYAPQNVMSALPPIATAKADIRKRSCLLSLRKQTCAPQTPMSAKGHKRTFTLMAVSPSKPQSFAQRTPNQINKRKMVSTDMPVEITTAGDTVLKYTLYCWAMTYVFAAVGIAESMTAACDHTGSIVNT